MLVAKPRPRKRSQYTVHRMLAAMFSVSLALVDVDHNGFYNNLGTMHVFL